MSVRSALRVAVAWALVAAVPAVAADQILVTIPGVSGESTVRGFEGSIDALSVTWGVTRADPVREGTAAGRFVGRPSFSDLTFTAHTSSASPVLQQAVPTGRHFPTVTITFLRSVGDGAPVPYLTYTLSTVTVTSFQFGASSGDDRPTESVSLSFGQIKTEYAPQKPDGTRGTPVVACWEVFAGRGCL